MREFFKYNFKSIIQIVVVLLLVILLVRSFTSIPDRTELLKYKLDKIDNQVDSLKKLQTKLLDSLMVYKNEIKNYDYVIKTTGRYFYFNFNYALFTPENKDMIFFKS